MESLEITAKTVDEAIELALVRLGKSRDEVQVSVLSEGSRGILGIGHEEARILVSPLQFEEDMAEDDAQPTSEEARAVAVEVLQTLLEGMRIAAAVELVAPPAEEGDRPVAAYLNISGDDLGILIGRRGETLSSLQFITNLIVSRKLRKWTRVQIDVGGYRTRRQETLRGLAQRMADRVSESRQPMPLEAMPAYERRIIHMALQDDPRVTTESFGEGDNRKVVILPKRA